jgi:hypothetical protein
MNLLKALPILGGLLLPALAQAQAGRDLTEIGLDLYNQANSPTALARMRKDLVNAPEAYLVRIAQPGSLVLLSKKSLKIPSLKYNVALRLLEVEDSTGSHVWPPGSLDGFYLGQGSAARHFRSYLVRDGGTKVNFVEVLTVDNASPIVLAVQHSYIHEDAQVDPILRTETRKARTEIGQLVLTGVGRPLGESKDKEPLRALSLNERSVLKLFGNQAGTVAAYATKEHLSYTDLGQVLRMVEYYNQKLASK